MDGVNLAIFHWFDKQELSVLSNTDWSSCLEKFGQLLKNTAMMRIYMSDRSERQDASINTCNSA